MRKLYSSLSKWDKRAILLLCFITVVVFGSTVKGKFLMSWDDNQQIVENEDVKNLSVKSIKNYFTKFYVGSYQPLASLSFAIEYAIFGKSSVAHHTTNLLLHLLNIALVFMLLRQLFEQKYIPLIVTAIFAIHPYQAEVLGWISTRSTLMYSAFLLIASNVFVNRLKSDSKVTTKVYIQVLILFILACLTKSAAIVFPFTLIALYVFVLRRYKLRLLIGTIPLFIISLATGLASISSRKSGGDTFQIFYSFYSAKEHITIRLKTLYFYLIEPFYQTKLHIYRAFHTSPDVETGALLPDYYMWQGLIAVAILAVIIFVVWRNRKNETGSIILFALAWFFINIGLHFNFLSVGPNMLAERYMYLPIIGLGILLVTLIQFVAKRYPKYSLNTILAVVFIPLFLFYGYTANTQSKTWENEIELYKQDIKYTSYHYSYLQLGRIYHKRKQNQKALDTYNAYIKINPNEPSMYLYRALLINDLGDKPYAVKDLYRVLDLRSSEKEVKDADLMFGRAFYHMGLIWQHDDPNKAKLYLDSALKYGNQNAIEILQTLNLQQSHQNPNVQNKDGYDFKSKVKQEYTKEEGSVYEIVPRCLADKKYDKALYYIEMMEMVAPDSSITYLLKAQAYIGLNQKAFALEVLEEATVAKNMDDAALNALKASLTD